MPDSASKEVLKLSNVVVYKEDQITVKEYLNNLDIFMFLPSWKREEPWARVVGEAMMSGCPIVATNKGGNKDQVLHGNNGFLCKTKDDFVKYLCYLCEHRQDRVIMGRNSRKTAFREFRTDVIINKLLSFSESLDYN